MVVYVVGGQQHADAVERPTWAQYQRAVVVRADLARGDQTVCLQYVPEHPPSDASICFGAATLTGDRLYACTKTEVLVFALPSFTLSARLSLPHFNDLHHVRPTPAGTLIVVSTGLDMVLECTIEGSVVGAWDAGGDGRPWTRFSPDVDYRRVNSTRPHVNHPNYCFELDGEPWVTRLEQRDAVCLIDRDKRIDIGVGEPHDGVVTPSHIWFTTADGRLVGVDRGSLQVDRVWDLTADTRAHTWCRGLAIQGDLAVVGFSRSRKTYRRAALSVLRYGLGALRELYHQSARLAVVQLSTGCVVQEVDLGGVPIAAVCSVHVADA